MKSKLIDTIESDFQSRAAAERAVDTVLGGIEKVVRGGDQVIVRGFGTFGVKASAARQGRNLHTGEPVDIPAKRTIGFKSKIQL